MDPKKQNMLRKFFYLSPSKRRKTLVKDLFKKAKDEPEIKNRPTAFFGGSRKIIPVMEELTAEKDG